MDEMLIELILNKLFLSRSETKGCGRYKGQKPASLAADRAIAINYFL